MNSIRENKMVNYKKTIGKFERNPDKKSVRRLKDLQNYFSNKKEVQAILKEKNPVLYTVFIKEFTPIDMGLTVINPGEISGEYYMTKGHIHKANNPEFYILLDGSGKLLIQNRSEVKTIVLKKGKIALIPRGYAHRLVNVGRKKLKVLTIYHEASKPKYGIKFKKKFFKR